MGERARNIWSRIGLLLVSAIITLTYFFQGEGSPMERWELVCYAFGAGCILGVTFLEKAKKRPLGQYTSLWVVMMMIGLLFQDLGWVGSWISLVAAAVGLTLFGLSFKYTFKPL